MHRKLPEDTDPTIKAATCEQYVLIRLQVAEQMIEGLTAEVDELNSKIKELVVERDGELAKLIRKKGRDLIISRARSWRSDESVTRDDEIKTFGVWANDYVDRYSIPECVTKDEFIREFEPELSDIYADLVDEAKEENE